MRTLFTSLSRQEPLAHLSLPLALNNSWQHPQKGPVFISLNTALSGIHGEICPNGQ